MTQMLKMVYTAPLCKTWFGDIQSLMKQKTKKKQTSATGLFFFILMEHRLGRGRIKNGPKILID